ncbi:MAG: hypothetical protein HYX69_23025 [Planctomycetia bacterium]|nr:hypothetical protein [Planctomycetia bacterium]
MNGHVLRRGDVIQLAAGAAYQGSFGFPDLGPGDDWVYIVSSRAVNLPTPGKRISDADIPNMATLKGPAEGGIAAGIDFSASHYRFVGIRFLSGRTAGETQYGIFATGYKGIDLNNAASQPAQLPKDIILDRCIVRARGGKERDNWGISMNAVGMAVLDSVIDKFQDDTTADANAIVTWMGGSRYLVQNCTLVASGENFLAGGTASRFGVAPSDFVFRNDYFYKPLSWNDHDPSYDGWLRAIKNLVELKNAKRVLIEECVFQNSWANRRSAGHKGDALVLTPRNGGGDEHGTVCVADVEIRRCMMESVGTVLRLSNADDLWKTQPLMRVWFHDNLACNVGRWTEGENAGLGLLLSFATSDKFATGSEQKASHLRFTHNTMVGGPRGHLNAYSPIFHEGVYGMITHSVFRDNIFQGSRGSWAVSGSNGPSPLVTLTTGWHVNAQFDHNAIFGEGVDGPYPPGNWTGTAMTEANIGFLAYMSNDYALSPRSLYAAGRDRCATDKKNLGVDGAVLKSVAERVAAVQSGRS